MAITDYELHQLRSDRAKRISNQVSEHRNGYYVRSETGGAKRYNVRVEGRQWKCECDDYKYRAQPVRKRRGFDFQCKHILAIEKTRARAAAKQKGTPRRRGFIPH